MSLGHLVGAGQGTAAQWGQPRADVSMVVCLGHEQHCALSIPTLTPGLYLAL